MTLSHFPGSRTSDYEYHLPDELIAQRPAHPRDSSRLMVVDRANATIAHRTFRDVAELIPPGDALVLNTTRVFRARLLGTRESGAPAEIFLLRPFGADMFEAMVHPGGKLRPGRTITITPDFQVEILDTTVRRTRIVRLLTTGDANSAIEQHGHVPLPPYIARADEPVDVSQYQTVYAQESGSVAAPTAGLHFTPPLLETIAGNGVKLVNVVLHVGAGTFKPVQTEDPSEHVMHDEWFELPEDAAATLNETRANGGRIWAVGTTSVRTLESVTDENGIVHSARRDTNIFIRPPYKLRAVDHVITNFHLPRSTLIMLVAAFAGHELTMRAYHEAVQQKYRFYSYGDAMCIL